MPLRGGCVFPRRFRASRSRVRVLAERLAAESAGPWPPARGTLLLFSPLRPRGGCLEYLKAPALGWVGEVGDALETQAGASPRDIWVPPTSTPSGSADPSPQPGSSRKSPALWIQRSQTFGTFECGPYCPRASIPLPPPSPSFPRLARPPDFGRQAAGPVSENLLASPATRTNPATRRRCGSGAGQALGAREPHPAAPAGGALTPGH